ncbi:MAG: TIGR01212 family radical SAM protein [bacterium]|nr:MAG: TIGR01212 family radical SAM protein [bacterium]
MIDRSLEGIKRYNNFGTYLKNIFGEKVFKVCLDVGFTCPNRDGTKARGGCIYCNNDSFKPETTSARKTLMDQLNDGVDYQRTRYGAHKFIAYFQAFSNTYDKVENLEALYREALSHPDVVGLSIGTRPDCVDDDILDLLEELAQETLLWVEYGLQSMHDKTLDYINRGHGLREFHETFLKTRKRKGINICVHAIHGLPFETKDMMLDTIKYLSDMGIDGIKIHQLHVVKNTLMKKMYERGEFSLPSLEEYLELLAESLEILGEDVVIQRLFGLGSKEILIAPSWDLGKGQFNTLIDRYLNEIDSYQGKKHQYFNRIEKAEMLIGSKKPLDPSIKGGLGDEKNPYRFAELLPTV